METNLKPIWGSTLDLKEWRVAAKQDRKFNKILFAANLELNPNHNTMLRQEAYRIQKILNRRMPTTLVFVKTPMDLEKALARFDPKRTLVFNWAEDIPGYVEGGPAAMDIIEREGFAHTASPSATQRLVFDRAQTFRKLKSLDIPIPKFMLVQSPADVGFWDDWPALVRPNDQHGSFGLAKLENADDARDYVQKLFVRFSPPAIVVQYIEGREFSVGLWSDGRETEAFKPFERDFSNSPDDIEDETDKAPDSQHAFDVLVTPKDLPDLVERKLLDGSKRAFHEFSIKVYGRVDWRLPKRSLDPVCVDVNPEPDISHDSSLASIFTKSGRGKWQDLINGIVDRTIKYYSQESS